MSTEISPSIGSVNFPPVVTGIPLDNNLFTPTTDQRFQIGSVCRPDDRSFYYGKSGAACLPGYISKLWPSYFFSAGTTVGVAALAGASTLLLVNTSQTITKDQFAGGYLTVGHGIAGGASTQTRKIIGNSPSAATPGTENITFALSAPLYLAVAAGVFAEVMVNPYSDLRGTNSDLASPGGMAPAGVTAANMYAWFQTWGPCWAVPGGGWTSQGRTGERYVAMVGDGSVNGVMTTAAVGFPIVGMIIQRDTSGSGGPPWIDLRIKY
jgi:hypothetical protein